MHLMAIYQMILHILLGQCVYVCPWPFDLASNIDLIVDLDLGTVAPQRGMVFHQHCYVVKNVVNFCQ